MLQHIRGPVQRLNEAFPIHERICFRSFLQAVQRCSTERQLTKTDSVLHAELLRRMGFRMMQGCSALVLLF